MVSRFLPLFFFGVLIFPNLLVLAQYTESNGLTCKDHPAFDRSWNPVLVRSWSFYRHSTDPLQEVYLPRYENHTFVPASAPSSTKYSKLDFFFTSGQRKNPSFRMYFQRRATVHLIVPLPTNTLDESKTASLPGGWASEGWVKRVGSSTMTIGIHQRFKRPMSLYWYMFSKKSSKKGGSHFIDLPQSAFIAQKMKRFRATGSYSLLIAESNGSPTKPVGSYKGKAIKPNTACPSTLHDVWMTTDPNTADRDTRGVKFRTWHPTWDPCFWCAYDHDHGSSPEHIFGYAPKYEYVARKNGRENESHNGFKGFVFRTKGLIVYYSLHMLNSSMRRVTVRFHTIQLVIADATTREIYVNVRHKGDFGFQSLRLRDTSKRFDFLALGPEDKKLQDKQEAERTGLKFRSIPVLDSDGGKFQQRNPKIIGQYEDWQTLPICSRAASRSRPFDTFRAFFKEPATGIKSRAQPDVRMDLGNCISDLTPRARCNSPTVAGFVGSPGLVRALFVSNIEFSNKYCPEMKNGVFYTNAFGNETRSGPGPSNIQQFLKPGFTTVLGGKFEVVEPWVGLHTDDGRGTFHDHGYAINPLAN